MSVSRVQAVDPTPQPRVEGLLLNPHDRAQALIPAPTALPTVSNQVPPAGTSIAPTTPVSFSLAGLFGRFVVLAAYTSGLVEAVWDGDAFTPLFLKASTMTGSGPARDVVLERTNGWSEAPTFEVVTPGGI